MMRRRILLVEDDDSIRLVAQLSLEEFGGYEVVAVNSGREALVRLDHQTPDLIVLDVSMPDMDGPQTLAALRRRADVRRVPVVFLTAHTQPQEVARFRALGAADVIAKPFDPRALCARVNSALGDDETRPAGLEDFARPRRALVVEDDPGIRYLLGFMLEQGGWQVVEACTGPEGLAALNGGIVTDVVLLDIMLPDVDGLQLLNMLRSLARWDGVPVIMLTAQGDEKSIRRALEGGASDYIGKPFDPADLMQRIERLTSSR